MDAWRRERVATWVSDFLDSTASRVATGLVREYAPEVLTAFLEGAAGARDVDPGEIEERDVKPGLLEGAARVELPASVLKDVPPLVAAFLGALEAEGRLAGGRALGQVALALAPAWMEASGPPKPYVRPGAPIGRNDPCPCGSGLKYKKCCLGRLGP
jgi:hypothetical protein